MSKEYSDSAPPPYGGGSSYAPPPGNPHPPPGNPYPQPGNPYPPQYMAGPGYPQATQSGYSQATTVVVQPTVTVIQVFRESPVHTNCPYCRAEVVTATSFETGTFAWVICCVLWFVGCGLGCCLIPFCLDGCKDVIHSCPNCRQQIARFSRM
ncbi:unnamed protein product [Candidula unifasciata]|uniref:LITAF domain-containing protein n=1 Tax=Candidula unifasciata TaxID=100452 RepID=A0A8S4A9L8_9EUPU|nr:unnamed protein product [Candidula unifasciata]